MRNMIEDIHLLPDIRPNTYEEDRYIKMKDAYKEGKQCAEACLGSPVTAAELAEEYYGDNEELIQQFLQGWNYQVHVMSEE